MHNMTELLSFTKSQFQTLPVSTVIKVENLSKQYRLGQVGTGTLSHDINRWWHKVRGNEDPYLKISDTNDRTQKGSNDYVWALKDINFEVNQGEVLGLIGKNGAGKSTLLKILSQVTTPTVGEVKLKGRIASLLEVGTGFHPELTGRENIYLNGAILGMTKKEINKRFDEIVVFSGVSKYIETPVKRYSSGMYVRLAFAVAAYLESEILIVDEVLAVGDAEFQKKCLGKMGDIAKAGRTVLFVSHNMSAIEALCTKALIISEGRNCRIGTPRDTIERYLQEVNTQAGMPLDDRTDRTGTGNIRFRSISFARSEGNDSNVFAIGDDINIQLSIENKYASAITVSLALSVNTAFESLVSCDSRLKGQTLQLPASSTSVLTCKITFPPLNFGNYEVNLLVLNGNEPEDWVTSAAKFSIESGKFDDRVTTNHFPVLAKFEWSIK